MNQAEQKPEEPDPVPAGLYLLGPDVYGVAGAVRRSPVTGRYVTRDRD